MNCPPTENESGLIALWNFELGNGGTVLDQSGNGNDGTINGATFDTNVPTQSCQLTTVNGCDSVAVLNLTVTEPDTSFTEVIACESYEWNGITYTESGTYTTVLNDLGNSMSFDGIDDNVNFGVIDLNGNNMNISFDVFVNENSFSQGVEIIGQNGFLGEDWFGIRYEQEYNQNDQNNYFSFRRYKEGYAYDVIIPFEMESEVWTNISVNYSLDNQIVNLYIDGEWVGTDNCTLEPFSNSNLEIGGNVADENSSFEGKIDNLTIWSTTLSENEIINLKECGTDASANNLIGYWNFEDVESSTVNDLSGNDNDGVNNGATYSNEGPEKSCPLTLNNDCNNVAILNLTINQPNTSFTDVTACESYEWNGETYTESGTYEYSVLESNNNYSMSFDGENDNVEINEISAYEANIHTLSLWYYSSDVSPGDLLSKDGESIDRQWLLQIATQSDKIQTHVWTTEGLYYSFSNIELEDNTWYYLSQVWNGNTLKLYVNGELDNSIETSGELVEGNQPIRIGGGSFSGTTLFSKAVLDNIEIWDVELTQNEIIENMYCSPTGIEDGLAGYWSFEQGEGNTVYDMSGSGNDGTINGATYSTDVPEQNCQLTNNSERL